MLFVFFPIDVIWLDSKRVVVDKRENIKPFTLLIKPRKSAKYIIEMPYGSSKNIKIKDKLEFNYKI